jgi:hypothetical protein
MGQLRETGRGYLAGHQTGQQYVRGCGAGAGPPIPPATPPFARLMAMTRTARPASLASTAARVPVDTSGADVFRVLRHFAHRAQENFFSDCLAATMNVDQALARAVVSAIFGATVGGVRVSTAHVQVRTRESCPGRARPDMLIDLSGRVTVGLENKLLAKEGPGQLRKYLRLDDRLVYRLAYVAGYEADIAAADRTHPKYVGPRDGRRHHFVWWDLFEVIRSAGTRAAQNAPLRRALVALFQDHGYEPVHNVVGDLNDDDVERKAENRRRFVGWWKETERRTVEAGWGDWYRKADPWFSRYVGRVRKVNLNPVTYRGLLLTRLYVSSGAEARAIARALDGAQGRSVPHARALVIRVLDSKSNRGDFPWSVAVGLSTQRLIGTRSTDRAISTALADYVLAVLSVAG